MVATGKAALGVVLGFVVDDSGERCASPEVDRLVKASPDESCRVAAIVSSHLIGGIGEAVRESGGLGQQQQARGLYAVAGDADEPRPLALILAILVAVDNPVDAPVLTVFDPQRPALDAQIEIAGRFGARDF